MGGLLRPIGQFLRQDRGAATLEFTLAFPFVILILFMFVEVGVLTLRTAMLKRGLSVATREVRVGSNTNFTEGAFRADVCNTAFFLNDCENSIMIEMAPVDIANLGDPGPTKCINRVDPDIQPLADFDPGDTEEIMLVRACIITRPVFPGAGLGANLAELHNGEYAIVATSAFMNEP